MNTVARPFRGYGRRSSHIFLDFSSSPIQQSIPSLTFSAEGAWRASLLLPLSNAY